MRTMMLFVALLASMQVSAQMMLGKSENFVKSYYSAHRDDLNIVVDDLFTNKIGKLVVKYKYTDDLGLQHPVMVVYTIRDGYITQEARVYDMTTFWENQILLDLRAEKPVAIGETQMMENTLKTISEFYYHGSGLYQWICLNYFDNQIVVQFTKQHYFEVGNLKKNVPELSSMR